MSMPTGLREMFPEIPDGAHWVEGPSTEVKRTHWWHGPMGTYKAENPRSGEDRAVGHQDSTRLTGRLFGSYPGIAIRHGAESLFPGEVYEWTDVDLRRDAPDVFYR